MEGDDWANYSEEENDSDCYVDDPNDDDLCYPSDDITKLQFRKDVSKARWDNKLGMAEIMERKGKMWTTTGIIRNGKLYSTIEETLFLIEIGALQLLDSNDESLNLKDIYTKASEGKNGYSWDSFEVYRHLKSLGYIIGRHNISWSMRTSKYNSNPLEDHSVLITKMFSDMQIKEGKPVFDVYFPNSKFRKSSPGDPCFILCITGSSPPSNIEIEDLERCSNGIPIKFCTVEHGRVSFFSFNKVEIPNLP